MADTEKKRISYGEKFVELFAEKASVDLDNLSEAGLEKLKALAAQVDSALSIKNQNEEEGAPGVIKIWTGSKEQYDALEYRYEDTLYYINDDDEEGVESATTAECILNQNDITGSGIRFWIGTLAEYNALKRYYGWALAVDNGNTIVYTDVDYTEGLSGVTVYDSEFNVIEPIPGEPNYFHDNKIWMSWAEDEMMTYSSSRREDLDVGEGYDNSCVYHITDDDELGGVTVGGNADVAEAVKNQNNGGELKFWMGTLAEYEALETVEDTTLYNIIDDDGEGNTTSVSAASASTVKNTNANGEDLRFWSGTLDEYNAIEVKDENTIYNISDDVIGEAQELQINSPFFLGMSQYFDNAPENASWLRSAGQFNTKALYPSMYEYVLENVNKGTKNFISVDEVTDDAPYAYIVDTANETFRLPLLNGDECIPSRERINNIFSTITSAKQSYTAPARGYVYIGGHIPSSGSIYTEVNDVEVLRDGAATAQNGSMYFPVSKGDIITVHTDGQTCTTSVTYFEYAKGNGDLYYFVGSVVTDASLITTGGLLNAVIDKVDAEQAARASMPSEKHIELTLGASGTTYDAPADGWFYLNLIAQNLSNFSLYNSTSLYGVGDVVGGQNYAMQLLLPCKKGDIVRTEYQLAPNSYGFKFIYANGSQPTN